MTHNVLFIEVGVLWTRLVGRRRVNRAMATWGVVSTIVAVLVAILSVVLPPVQPDQLSALPIVVVVLLVIAAALFLVVVPRAARSNRPAVVSGSGLRHHRPIIGGPALLERVSDR